MSKSTISTFQLFALFPDEQAARVYLEARIWPTTTWSSATWTDRNVRRETIRNQALFGLTEYESWYVAECTRALGGK